MSKDLIIVPSDLIKVVSKSPYSYKETIDKTEPIKHQERWQVTFNGSNSSHFPRSCYTNHDMLFIVNMLNESFRKGAIEVSDLFEKANSVDKEKIDDKK